MRDTLQGKELRVFVSENHKWKDQPLYEAIVELANHKGMAGATASKGLMGFGMHHEVHTAKLLRLSENLPVIIDIVDTEENIRNFLPYLDDMIGHGLVVLKDVDMVIYRPAKDK